MRMTSVPDNYRMPAEWERHSRTFIAWPVRRSMCEPEDYSRVCSGYAQFIHAIAEFEPVTVLVNREDELSVSGRFSERNMQIIVINHDDSWFRDNGPTFILNGDNQLAGINWRFNAWGEKYRPYDQDDEAAAALLAHAAIPCFDAPLVLEGGSIHVDGAGCLMTTEQCLLNSNRNPDLTRERISSLLKAYLGIQQIIWLKQGLSGDETDGHIDNIACFYAPGKVLIQVCDDPDDENYRITKENLAILEQAVDALGNRIEIVRVQQPPARYHHGKRLTLSYLNFYLVNGGVILPVFGGDAAATDQAAIATLRKAFPERRIRTVDGMAIVTEGGNVHCATQQMPAGKEEEANCVK